MSQLAAPPPTDKRLWRQLLKLTHPDGSGSHELFIWCQALHEHVRGDGIEEPPRSTQRQPPKHHPKTDEKDRIPFVDAYATSFTELTRLAVAMAEDVEEPYASLLRLLADCDEVGATDRLHTQQHQGATYRTLAAVGHHAGMSKAERVGWYRVAESVPLSQRHAGHLLMKLRESPHV